MRRDCQPHFVDVEGNLAILRRVAFADRVIGETFLQEQLHNSPSLLPVEELDDSFGPLVSLGREIWSIDNLFVSPNGRITIVETKLWRNPEATRQVLAQIIDYAKRLSSLTYEQFEQKCRSALQPAPLGEIDLYTLVSTHFPSEVGSEADFTDAVSKSLRTARFMLLVVGDGIRENLEGLLGVLHQQPQMLFTFGLVEMQIYESDSILGKLIVPHLVYRTNEIVRAVVRIETGKDVTFSVSLPPPEPGPDSGKTLDEAEFLEMVTDARTKTVFTKLMSFAKEIGSLKFSKKTALACMDFKGTGELRFFRLRQKKRGFVRILPLSEQLRARGVDEQVATDMFARLRRLFPNIPLKPGRTDFARAVESSELENKLDEFTDVFREAVARISAMEPTRMPSVQEDDLMELDL